MGEIYELRLLLEPRALRLSLRRRDWAWRADVESAWQALDRAWGGDGPAPADIVPAHTAFHEALTSGCGNASCCASPAAWPRRACGSPARHGAGRIAGPTLAEHATLYELCVDGDVDVADARRDRSTIGPPDPRRRSARRRSARLGERIAEGGGGDPLLTEVIDAVIARHGSDSSRRACAAAAVDEHRCRHSQVGCADTGLPGRPGTFSGGHIEIRSLRSRNDGQPARPCASHPDGRFANPRGSPRRRRSAWWRTSTGWRPSRHPAFGALDPQRDRIAANMSALSPGRHRVQRQRDRRRLPASSPAPAGPHAAAQIGHGSRSRRACRTQASHDLLLVDADAVHELEVRSRARRGRGTPRRSGAARCRGASSSSAP